MIPLLFNRRPSGPPPAPLPGTLARYAAAGWTPGTWADSSGNGNHATQASAGNRFTLTGATTPNGTAVPTSAGGQRWMRAPDVFPTTGSYCKIALVRPTDLTQYGNILSGENSGNTAHILWFPQSANPQSYRRNTPLVTSSVAATQGAWTLIEEIGFASVRGNVTSTRSSQLWVNGAYAGMVPRSSVLEQAASDAAVFLGAVGLSGGSLGDYGMAGDFADLTLANYVPSAAQINSHRRYLNATYGTSFPLFTRQRLLVGDSITAGYRPSGTGTCWAALNAASAPAGTYTLNLGQSGWLMQELYAQREMLYAPLLAGGVPTDIAFFAGTNDSDYGGRTGAQVWADTQAFVAWVKARNSGGIAAVVPMLPRGSANESNRTTLNGSILAGAAAMGARTLDPTGVPIYAPGANTALIGSGFDADGIHLDDTGHPAEQALIGPLFLPPAVQGTPTWDGTTLTVKFNQVVALASAAGFSLAGSTGTVVGTGGSASGSTVSITFGGSPGAGTFALAIAAGSVTSGGYGNAAASGISVADATDTTPAAGWTLVRATTFAGRLDAAAVGAGGTLVDGWRDLAGGVWSVAAGKLVGGPVGDETNTRLLVAPAVAHARDQRVVVDFTATSPSTLPSAVVRASASLPLNGAQAGYGGKVYGSLGQIYNLEAFVGVGVSGNQSISGGFNAAHAYRLDVRATGRAPTALAAVLTDLTAGAVVASTSESRSDADWAYGYAGLLVDSFGGAAGQGISVSRLAHYRLAAGPAADLSLACLGDSLTASRGAGGGNTEGTLAATTYPGQLVAALEAAGRRPMALNLGVAGNTFGDLAARYPVQARGLASATGSVLVLMCGHNDLAQGSSVTGAVCYSRLTSFLSTYVLSDPWTRIVVMTIPDAEDGAGAGGYYTGWRTQRVDYNSRILASLAAVDSRIRVGDLTGDQHIGVSGAASASDKGTYYSDTAHLTATGYGLLAGYAYAAATAA